MGEIAAKLPNRPGCSERSLAAYSLHSRTTWRVSFTSPKENPGVVMDRSAVAVPAVHVFEILIDSPTRIGAGKRTSAASRHSSTALIVRFQELEVCRRREVVMNVYTARFRGLRRRGEPRNERACGKPCATQKKSTPLFVHTKPACTSEEFGARSPDL